MLSWSLCLLRGLNWQASILANEFMNEVKVGLTLSSPNVFIGDLVLPGNDTSRFPIKTFGNDNPLFPHRVGLKS